jgi:hypothetical protein
MNKHDSTQNQPKKPSQFHTCVQLVNVYSGQVERGFCIEAMCMSADLLVSRIQKQYTPPKNSDVRLKFIRVVNMTAQGRPRKKRRKG